MRTVLEPHVDAANHLTRRWCDVAGDRDFVVSGAGLWPLLGLMASAAGGPARAELEAAVGMPGTTARPAALRLMEIMDDAADLSAALGAWVDRTLPLNDEWLSGLPVGTVDPAGSASRTGIAAWPEPGTERTTPRSGAGATPPPDACTTSDATAAP